MSKFSTLLLADRFRLTAIVPLACQNMLYVTHQGIHGLETKDGEVGLELTIVTYETWGASSAPKCGKCIEVSSRNTVKYFEVQT